MNRFILALLIGVFFVPLEVTPVKAGMISRACMNSPRKAKSVGLCGCIQKVANKTLNRNDRRLAAKFYKKPQMAQDVRQADNARLEVFWKKYKAFAAHAKATCG